MISPEFFGTRTTAFRFAMKTILSLDLQRDVARAVLFDARARVVAQTQRATPVVRPSGDREEQDAVGLARATLDAAIATLETALEATDGDLELAGIGISVPRDAFVVWDLQSGEPVAPAIVGRDRRAAAACRALNETVFAGAVSLRSGLAVDPRFTAPRLAFLLDEHPALRARAERGELAFGTLDSWLVWTLSGGTDHRIGAVNAAGTSLYDIERHRWDERVARIFGVPSAMQPIVVPSSGFIAKLTPRSATLDRLERTLHAPLRRLTALVPPQTPILAVTTERGATLVAQRCVAPGTASASFDDDRTTVLYNTGPALLRSRSSLWTAMAWHRPGPDEGPPDPFGDDFLLPEFPVESWDRERGWVTTMEVVVLKYPVVLPQDGEYAYCLEDSIDDGPSTDDDDVRTTRALRVCDVVARMQDDMAMTIGELCVDGVGARDDRAMQAQADLLGVRVRRPDTPFLTALGAALLAGTAAGLWDSLDDAARAAAEVDTARVFEPALDAATRRRRVLDFRALRSCDAARAGTTTD